MLLTGLLPLAWSACSLIEGRLAAQRWHHPQGDLLPWSLIEKMPYSWISWRHFLKGDSFLCDNSSLLSSGHTKPASTPWLSWNSLCRLGSPPIQRDLPASVSRVLGLEAFTTMTVNPNPLLFLHQGLSLGPKAAWLGWSGGLVRAVCLYLPIAGLHLCSHTQH